MRYLLPALSALILLTTVASAADGLVTLESPHSVSVTTDRLENTLQEKGLTVFARIDHAAGAHAVGEELPPTELLVFGNPKIGTPLMRCAPTMAIDLPQKALVWQDAAGTVRLAYNDPAALARRHDVQGCEPVLAKVAQVLATFAKIAVAP